MASKFCLPREFVFFCELYAGVQCTQRSWQTREMCPEMGKYGDICLLQVTNALVSIFGDFFSDMCGSRPFLCQEGSYGLYYAFLQVHFLMSVV